MRRLRVPKLAKLGTPFYHHHATNTTQWEHPAAASTNPESFKDCINDPESKGVNVSGATDFDPRVETLCKQLYPHNKD